MTLPRCSSFLTPAGIVVGVVLAAALGGCGGGLDGNNYELTTETPPTLSGTVSLGAPVLDATVLVTDANGVVASVPVASDGSYRGLSLAGMAAPFSLKACGVVDGTYGCHDGIVDPDGTGNVRPLPR